MTEREQFEAWLHNEAPPAWGDMENLRHAAWVAWQAARSQPGVVVLDEVSDAGGDVGDIQIAHSGKPTGYDFIGFYRVVNDAGREFLELPPKDITQPASPAQEH